MKHLYHLGILQVLTLLLTAVRNDSPKVTVSWELGMGSCTMALPPAADPLAQTEGNTTSGESLGPSPTSAQPLLIQSSTSSLYRPPQPEPSSQGHPRTSAPDTTDDSSPSPQTHHSGRRAYVLEASWALGKGQDCPRLEHSHPHPCLGADLSLGGYRVRRPRLPRRTLTAEIMNILSACLPLVPTLAASNMTSSAVHHERFLLISQLSAQHFALWGQLRFKR